MSIILTSYHIMLYLLHEVQMLNLRLGGFLRPAAKNKKQPELADPDFDFVGGLVNSFVKHMLRHGMRFRDGLSLPL